MNDSRKGGAYFSKKKSATPIDGHCGLLLSGKSLDAANLSF